MAANRATPTRPSGPAPTKPGASLRSPGPDGVEEEEREVRRAAERVVAAGFDDEVAVPSRERLAEQHAAELHRRGRDASGGARREDEIALAPPRPAVASFNGFINPTCTSKCLSKTQPKASPTAGAPRALYVKSHHL